MVTTTAPARIKMNPRGSLISLALLVSIALLSCAAITRPHLRIETAQPSEVTGTYTLLLYGCRYPDDLEDVAILAREGNPAPFDIYSLPTRYTVKSGLSADEALKEAGKFVQCSVHYQNTRFSKITDAAGAVVGYEVRPLYSPIRFGMYDVLNIQYVQEESKIVVYIRLDPMVELQLRDEGGRDRGNH